MKVEKVGWSLRVSFLIKRRLQLRGQDIGTIEQTDLNGRGPYVYRAHHMHMHSPAEHKINGV